MASIYQNLRNDRQFSASTGLTKAEFEELFSVFKGFYKPKSKNMLTNREAALSDPREALFFILHYYKSYPILQNLGLYFGFSDKTASHYLDQLRPVLKATLGELSVLTQRVFGSQAEFEQAFEGIDDLIIDVSELNTQRPENEELKKSIYSGKKTPYRKMAVDLRPAEENYLHRPSLERCLS